jgi:regulator of replication initiation timing
MSRACATLSDFDFSSDDSSNSEEDEKVKSKKGDFTGLCLMTKGGSSWNVSDSDVSEDLSFESLSLKVAKLENALCNQDKLLCKVFRENKKLNLELESSFSKIASLRSVHDDMSAKPYDNYKIIMVNYADLWLVHAQIATQLNGAKLELRELKARSLLLGACTSCPLLKSNLEACSVEIKKLKNNFDHSSRYSILSSPCKTCGSLKGKLFHAIKENTELKQEVAYLTSCLERTVVSKKMIEDDLSQVEESATKSQYKLGVRFERCENRGVKSAPKFVPASNYHKEEKTIKSTKTQYPSSPKPSFNPRREVRKENPKPREEAFICMFVGRAGHLDEFCFCRKRIEKRRFDYGRNSYRDEFTDFLPRSYSHALAHFFHGPNHHSYGFGS